MLGLTAFWLLALVVLPYFLMFEFSLRPYLTIDKIGGPEDVYTLKNYVTLFSNTIHFGVFLRTILASAFVTALCLVLCYPMAFFLAKIVQPKNAADPVPAAADPVLGQRDPALLRLVHHPVLSGPAQRGAAWASA